MNKLVAVKALEKLVTELVERGIREYADRYDGESPRAIDHWGTEITPAEFERILWLNHEIAVGYVHNQREDRKVRRAWARLHTEDRVRFATGAVRFAEDRPGSLGMSWWYGHDEYRARYIGEAYSAQTVRAFEGEYPGWYAKAGIRRRYHNTHWDVFR